MSAQRRHYEGTSVSESQSLLDIDRLLKQHGVSTVRLTSSADLFRLEFAWPYKGQDLAFRIDLTVPERDQAGYSYSPKQREQERRRRLRVLFNHIKAKLVAVEDGLVDMEQEFLPYLIGPGNRTMGEAAAEQLAAGHLPNAVPLLEIGRGANGG